MTAYSCQKLETIKISLNRWEIKQTVVHLYNGILLRNKKQWVVDSHNNMDESERHFAKCKNLSQLLCPSEDAFWQKHKICPSETQLCSSVSIHRSLELSSQSVLFSGSVHLHQDGGHREMFFFLKIVKLVEILLCLL